MKKLIINNGKALMDSTGNILTFESDVTITRDNESIGLIGDYDGTPIEITEAGKVDIKALIDEKKIPLEVNVNIESNENTNTNMVLPLRQTNPDCYFYKVFSANNSTIEIDFAKFVEWHIKAGDNMGLNFTSTGGPQWPATGSGSSSTPIGFPVVGFKLDPDGYNQHVEAYLNIQSSNIDLIFACNGSGEVYSTLVNEPDGKTPFECLSEVGNVVINLDDLSFTHSSAITLTCKPCIVDSISMADIKGNNGSFSTLGYNDYIEFTNSINWVKISENN